MIGEGGEQKGRGCSPKCVPGLLPPLDDAPPVDEVEHQEEEREQAEEHHVSPAMYNFELIANQKWSKTWKIILNAVEKHSGMQEGLFGNGYLYWHFWVSTIKRKRLEVLTLY